MDGNHFPNQNILKQGWLMKKGGMMKIWHRRWFVLADNFLFYFYKEDDIKTQGSVLLHNHRVLEVPVSPEEPEKFIFEIVPGKHHKGEPSESVTLCAASDVERQQWIKLLRRVLYAKIGGAIFGQKFEEMMEYTHKNGRKIPLIIEQCVEYLYEHGLEIEGIFRLPGRAAVTRELKEKYDCGESVALHEADCHSVASLLKTYLRELPESIVPCNLYQKYMNHALRFMEAKDENAKMEIVSALKSDMSCLPPDNYTILKYLCKFLNSIGEKASVNKMTMLNLATVFGPNFIRHMDDNPELFMLTTDLTQNLAFMLINYFDVIFTLEYSDGKDPVPVEDLLCMSLDESPTVTTDFLKPEAAADLMGIHFDQSNDVFASDSVPRNLAVCDSGQPKSQSPGSQLEFKDNHFQPSDSGSKSSNHLVERQDSNSSAASQETLSPRGGFTEEGLPIPPRRKSKIVRGRRLSDKKQQSRQESNSGLTNSSENASNFTTDVLKAAGIAAVQYEHSAETEQNMGTVSQENKTSPNVSDINSYKVEPSVSDYQVQITSLKEELVNLKNKYETTVKALKSEHANMMEKYEKRIQTMEVMFTSQNERLEAERIGRAEAIEKVMKLQTQLHEYQMCYGELPQK